MRRLEQSREDVQRASLYPKGRRRLYPDPVPGVRPGAAGPEKPASTSAFPDGRSLARAGRGADLLLQSLLDGEGTPYRSVAHAAADPTAPHTLRGAVAVSSAASSGPAVPMPAAMPPTTTVDGVALVDRGLISGRGGLFGGLEYQRGGEHGSCQDRGRCKYERGRNCDAYQCAAKALIRNHRYFLARLHRDGRRPPLSRFGIRARVYELGIPFGGSTVALRRHTSPGWDLPLMPLTPPS